MIAEPLSPAQVAFLRFAITRPTPFSWRWLRSDGAISLAPRSHHSLVARKIVQGDEIRCAITTAELDALAPYWAKPLLELNDAGRAILAARTTKAAA